MPWPKYLLFLVVDLTGLEGAVVGLYFDLLASVFLAESPSDARLFGAGAGAGADAGTARDDRRGMVETLISYEFCIPAIVRSSICAR